MLARKPSFALDIIKDATDTVGLARVALLTIGVCAGLLGATLGFYRGGAQILFAAIKLPLVIVLTAAVLTPLLTCVNHALERPANLRRDLLLVLSSLARATIVLAALLPLLWLGLAIDAAYHTMVMPPLRVARRRVWLVCTSLRSGFCGYGKGQVWFWFLCWVPLWWSVVR